MDASMQYLSSETLRKKYIAYKTYVMKPGSMGTIYISSQNI